MGYLRDEQGHVLEPCGRCLTPPHGRGCTCPVPAPPARVPKPKPPKPEPKIEPEPGPAPTPKAAVYHPPVFRETNPIVAGLEALNEKMSQAVDLLKILAKAK